LIVPDAITLVDETGSTNADLAAALRSDQPPCEGQWLVARRQTAGRGRQGREWQDGSGNFMGSTVVAIRNGDPPPSSLGFVAALAVAAVVDKALNGATRTHVKWPNDVLIDGAKVAGLLMERVGENIVVGIGVNLFQAPDIPERKTTALSEHGTSPSIETFAARLSSYLTAMINLWRSEGLAPILRTFLEASIHKQGMMVNVHDADGSRISGTFAGLDAGDGALRLRLADGSSRVIRAGDID